MAPEGFVLIQAYIGISVPVQLLTMADAICGGCRSFALNVSRVEMLCFWLIFIGRDHVRRSVCLALRKANKRVPPCYLCRAKYLHFVPSRSALNAVR
jgi:hypothetical protein